MIAQALPGAPLPRSGGQFTEQGETRIVSPVQLQKMKEVRSFFILPRAVKMTEGTPRVVYAPKRFLAK
jgi:hypothetical protein